MTDQTLLCVLVMTGLVEVDSPERQPHLCCAVMRAYQMQDFVQYGLVDNHLRVGERNTHVLHCKRHLDEDLDTLDAVARRHLTLVSHRHPG